MNLKPTVVEDTSPGEHKADPLWGRVARAEAVALGRLRPYSVANATLKAAATLWFLVTVIGQWMFAYYIIVFYGGSAAAGNVEAWNDRLFHGIIEGDLIGNVAVALHLFVAFMITVGGPLQLIPQIRTHAITFHRWNGRLYIGLTQLPIWRGWDQREKHVWPHE